MRCRKTDFACNTLSKASVSSSSSSRSNVDDSTNKRDNDGRATVSLTADFG